MVFFAEFAARYAIPGGATPDEGSPNARRFKADVPQGEMAERNGNVQGETAV